MSLISTLVCERPRSSETSTSPSVSRCSRKIASVLLVTTGYLLGFNTIVSQFRVIIPWLCSVKVNLRLKFQLIVTLTPLGYPYHLYPHGQFPFHGRFGK